MTHSPATNARPVIGVTGGIGSGKSLVTDLLARKGCMVIDADRIGHAVLAEPAVVSALAEAFGADIVGSDGSVDRRRLAERAFADEASADTLNRITHPPLRAELVRRIEAFRQDPRIPAAVLDAALLFETDWHTLCDVVAFVDAPFEQRATRVRQQRGWSAEELRRREKAQKPLDTKRAGAQYILENNSSVPHLQRQVCQLYHRVVCPETGSSGSGLETHRR